MPFKASKKRVAKTPDRVGRGSPIVANAGIMNWYDAELNKMCRSMVDDYREKIKAALEAPAVEKLFAEDAKATNILSAALGKLSKRWENIFSGFAAKLAPQFVDKAEKAATAATLHSLSVAGIEAPIAKYSSNVANTLQAATEFNFTLIKGLQKEVHNKIHESVMLSLTSPNPEQQGQSGIENALKEIGGFTKKRTRLISRDQTSKLYSSLSDERMDENGVDEFEWAHSSAGEVPRMDHVHKDGMIFKLNDPRLWTGPKADQGPPGWAINCRCRKIPII